MSETKKDTPLHIAIDSGHAELVKILIKNGANINAVGAFGDAPVHIAAKSGNAEIVRLLINAGADLKIKNEKGYTPLDLTTLLFGDNAEIIELLKKAKQGQDMI